MNPEDEAPLHTDDPWAIETTIIVMSHGCTVERRYFLGDYIVRNEVGEIFKVCNSETHAVLALARYVETRFGVTITGLLPGSKLAIEEDLGYIEGEVLPASNVSVSWTGASDIPSVVQGGKSHVELVDEMIKHIPGVEDEADCPECSGRDTIYGLIQHVNDTHRWPREKIADWLDTLDADLIVRQDKVEREGATVTEPKEDIDPEDVKKAFLAFSELAVATAEGLMKMAESLKDAASLVEKMTQEENK